MIDQPIVGDWRFDSESAALIRPGCTKRLADRSARTLALLCRRRGEVVSKAQILEEVWKGRTVSDNSVAVVITDLRRALGEDARSPRHIETIGKRGYRLSAALEAVSTEKVPVDEPEPTLEAAPKRRTLWALAVAAGTATIIAVMLLSIRPAPPVALTLGPVRNDTGSSRYDPLAAALGALVRERMSKMPGVIARDAGPRPSNTLAERQLEMESRLIIWNRTPTLSLTAINPSDGTMVWSGMAVGQPDLIASATIEKLADFRRNLQRRAP